jgi:cell division protein ZapA
MSELIPINIVIADRTYRIRTTPSDEEIIRKTVNMINQKIIEFKTQFAGNDMQDYISMVIIWYATQNAGGEGNSMLNQEMAATLSKMELQISAVLQNTTTQL